MRLTHGGLIFLTLSFVLGAPFNAPAQPAGEPTFNVRLLQRTPRQAFARGLRRCSLKWIPSLQDPY